MEQTLTQALRSGNQPVLAYRLDRQPWRFVVALRDLLPSLKGQSPHLTTEMGINEFVLLVRERIAC